MDSKALLVLFIPYLLLTVLLSIAQAIIAYNKWKSNYFGSALGVTGSQLKYKLIKTLLLHKYREY
jgi:hypothetical protein